MKTEEKLLNDRHLRDEMSNNYEILEKVKQLLLIPNIDKSTIRQVSEYYEVEEGTIKMLVSRNREELKADGLQSLNGLETKDYLVSNKLLPTNGKGFFEVEGIRFAYRSNLLFTRRCILRVGMLLQNSEVAKEVRTQLLNIEEKTSIEIKTQDINEEQGLMLSVGMAVASGDVTAVTIATTNLIAFKNRHIVVLEESVQELSDNNKALAGHILEWKDRASINKAVRTIAAMQNMPFGVIWKELYDELLYKHSICLARRGKSPLIQHIKEDEWNLVLQSLSAICENSGISISKVMSKAKFSENILV